MSMYFIGIDISKYKHDCCIISAADQKVVSKVTIKNNKAGFNELLTIIHSLANPADIRIGFESTAHYALNLELFLENSLLTFMEVNPVLISEYKKSKTLRRTKTDSVDCESIARWLMTVEYKPHSKGFYHASGCFVSSRIVSLPMPVYTYISSLMCMATPSALSPWTRSLCPMSWVNSRNTGHTCSGFSKSATVVIPCPTLLIGDTKSFLATRERSLPFA